MREGGREGDRASARTIRRNKSKSRVPSLGTEWEGVESLGFFCPRDSRCQVRILSFPIARFSLVPDGAFDHVGRTARFCQRRVAGAAWHALMLMAFACARPPRMSNRCGAGRRKEGFSSAAPEMEC